MRRRGVLALAGLGMAGCETLGLGRPARPVPLARFPNGTFLENLLVLPDGTVLFTSYFARAIESWSPTGGARRWAETPLHPVSLAQLPGGGFALAGHGAPFSAGPEAMRGQAAVLLLDAAGAVQRRLPLPEAIFPNGCLLVGPQRLLLADSALGRVWDVALDSGRATAWLDHPALRPNPAQARTPGVNGIKFSARRRAVLLSNSGTRQLMRVPLAGDVAPAGPPALVASFPGIDDFCVLPDGTIWAATHAEGVARLAPGSSMPERVPAEGLEGNTAVLPVPGGGGLYVLGTGALFEGGKGEAMLARLPVAL